MKRAFILASLCLLMTYSAAGQSFTSYVNPFVGTGAVDSQSLSGNCFPGATVPFGMVQPGPDTSAEPSWGSNPRHPD